MNTLMTWNILEGFLSLNKRDEKIIDEDRLASAQELIKQYNPDILVLNEALYCEPYKDIYHDYKKFFGYEYSSSRLYDNEWGNAILSQFPIAEERSNLLYSVDSSHNRGSLAVNIITPENSIWVCTLHPHPHRKASLRASDFDKFLVGLDGPIILAGDFNAINPKDQIDIQLLRKAFEEFTRFEEVDTSLQRFIDAGKLLFNDVLPKYNIHDMVQVLGQSFTIPTNLININKDSGMRIDHILANEKVKSNFTNIIYNPLADIASDHYPVLMEFFII